MNQATHMCLGQNSKSSYVRVDGRTKSPTSALVRILSLPTYTWTDGPSHQQVHWSEFYVFLPTGGRMNQVTHKCFGQNSMSSYLRVDGRTKSPTSALVRILCLPTYGWIDEPSHPQVPWSKFKIFCPTGGSMNQVTYNCLGKNCRSSYQRVDGPTKSPTSALVKILSLPTYWWKDEPSQS